MTQSHEVQDESRSNAMNHAHTVDEDKKVNRAAWVSVIVNVFLTLVKGIIGYLTGSRALFADAVHSAADLAGSIAVTIGLRVARKPPDKEHPYGHGKAELISTAIVACLLIIASLEVCYRSIVALWAPPTAPSWVSAAAAFGAIVVKEFLYQYNFRLGKRYQSKGLIAQAVDHRSDVYASIAALIGILLSILGSRTHILWLQYMDAVAGAVVAVLVLVMGYRIAQDSVHLLMDRVLSPDELKPYRALIESIPGVRGIDELRARDHGTYVIMDVKIQVDAEMTVAAGHEIATDVKQELLRAEPRVHDVLVHVNPYFKTSKESAK